MAAPYSLDLRERVMTAVAAGMSRAQAAEHYQVSHSSAIRWTRRQVETGSPAALPMGGKKPFALANEEAWIQARVDEKPDLTGRELLAELNPIEKAFSKLKTLLRKANARTIAQVEKCIASLLREIDPAECINYFQAAGYASS
jgi:transposase